MWLDFNKMFQREGVGRRLKTFVFLKKETQLKKQIKWLKKDLVWTRARRHSQADRGRNHYVAYKPASLLSVILQHKASEALTMTLQLLDCALWWSHCKMALISNLCECVGNRAAFPVLWEKTLQRKMAGNLQGLLIRAMKVSQSTWERGVLIMSGPTLKANQQIRSALLALNQ